MTDLTDDDLWIIDRWIPISLFSSDVKVIFQSLVAELRRYRANDDTASGQRVAERLMERKAGAPNAILEAARRCLQETEFYFMPASGKPDVRYSGTGSGHRALREAMADYDQAHAAGADDDWNEAEDTRRNKQNAASFIAESEAAVRRVLGIEPKPNETARAEAAEARRDEFRTIAQQFANEKAVLQGQLLGEEENKKAAEARAAVLADALLRITQRADRRADMDIPSLHATVYAMHDIARAALDEKEPSDAQG